MRIKEDRDRYNNEVFGLEDADLKKVRERMVPTGKEQMSISGAEARILQFLIRSLKLKRVIEFGTFFGYSALAMAKALPEDGLVITLKKAPKIHAQSKKTFRASPEGKLVLPLGGEADALKKEIESRGPFDFVFIDEKKSGYQPEEHTAELQSHV